MPTYRYLDLSLSYITPRDQGLLGYFDVNLARGQDAGLRVATYPGGFFVRGSCLWLSQEPEAREAEQKKYLAGFETAGFSPQFCLVIKRAWQENATMIQLYISGERDPELPTPQ